MEIKPILLFIGGIGGTEALLIMLAILLFFGAKRIPELARGLGRGIREFRDASNEIKSSIESSVATPNQPETPDPDNRLTP